MNLLLATACAGLMLAVAACSSVPVAPSGDAAAVSPAAAPSGATGAAPVALPPTSNAQPLPAATATGEGLQPISAALAAGLGVARVMPPADLWERIRRGFAMPDLDNDSVRERAQWYASRPDYMERMTERASKYLFHVVEELERRNMPSELALLPFIESAFNPHAQSSAKAVGIWQFMPNTGKNFDLKQNVFRDDRRDVLASTRAALDYLQQLYNRFGDWHLALAAYNWGQGNVARAIARNQKLGLGTSYTDLVMPNETRLYIPKLQAIKNRVARAVQSGEPLPAIGNHPYFQTVDIQRDMDVALAARLAEVELEDFRALNPSMNRPLILAAGSPQILLPWDNATVFTRNLNAYTGPQLASWTAWIAPTTLKPADVAKRVGMSEQELRRVNNIPARVLIKVGSTLLVPRTRQRDLDVASQVAQNGQINLAPEVVLRRTVVKVGKSDTLASVARRYRVDVAAIAEWNKLTATASLHAGQALVLFVPSSGAANSRKARPPVRVAKKRPGTTVAQIR